MIQPIFELQNVCRTFTSRRSLLGKKPPPVHAVNGVSIQVTQGQTLGIVGESGCGKSTLAKMIVMLERPTAGTIRFKGMDLEKMNREARRRMRAQVQFVFQDPLSSLNPRKTIRQILEVPLKKLVRIPAKKRKARLDELLELVKLRPEFLERYPHEFSGGQSQRIGIARALAAEPHLILLDEPVSALDVSVQAQVLNLLRELKQELELTYVFISHDLAVVENVSDTVAVMYLGQIVEYAPRALLFSKPLHPYTGVLLSSVPVPGKRVTDRALLKGELPGATALRPGCPFEPRCPCRQDKCAKEKPMLEEMRRDHFAACYFPYL
ncbi:MAG: ATP-binding cassette domain-containing protein [Deltaproteobacteria bacterium]|jgi:peptide/nickel transport system ATP-binding protein|nr:ATP-binding cassette domain-containing protein [Deltaproteobacteria bacterium]